MDRDKERQLPVRVPLNYDPHKVPSDLGMAARLLFKIP